MSLSVVKPGMLDTIQDEGRHGYGNWGINPRGAPWTAIAAAVANMLVGNCGGEAVFGKFIFPGPQLLFEQNALIAISGANFTPHLDDEPIPVWQPVCDAEKNTVLHFPKHKDGARCYLQLCADEWL